MFSGILVGILHVKCRLTVRQVLRDARSFDKIYLWNVRRISFERGGNEIWTILDGTKGFRIRELGERDHS